MFRPRVHSTDDPDQASHGTAGAAERGQAADRQEPRRQGTFPIVGIGCSAGGLEALERLLTHVPAGFGMAFVVVQHLDPKHDSSLTQLLQRMTLMRVLEAGDNMTVRPDCVYVIPPNADLSLLHGVLYLLDPSTTRGLRLPVDFFLRALGEDQRERAIAIILSGMGSDGVLGLRAIKENSGLTLAQDPASADADGMPRSAIAAGLADIVALPEEMPARIADYVRRGPWSAERDVSPTASARSALDKIVILLRDRCGNDFSLYKSNTLYRRIERRCALHQLPGSEAYVQFLRDNPQEIDLLFKELLIGVTNFFRDPAMWEYLLKETIPAMLARHPGGGTLRAWVPGCSSGEEAYSLAIVFCEALDASQYDNRPALQIYATDLDPDAIDKARAGLFPKNIVADVSAERLARFFVSEESGYRVSKQVRDMVIFAPQNIVSDPPFTRLDLLSCRNLLIYFRPELQKKLLPLFHYALTRDGVLVLGSAESIGDFGQLFRQLHPKWHVFGRLEPSTPLARLALPAGTANQEQPASVAGVARRDSLEFLTDQLIQQTFAPAAVLVSSDGDILYISGRTGKYLEPAAGRVNVNIFAMARSGLREALTGVLHTALHQEAPLRLDGLVVGTNGGSQVVDVVVQGLTSPEALRNRVLIVFQDVESPPIEDADGDSAIPARPDPAMQELQQLREALRMTHLEMQTSVEDLKSANEELQSTNEELQSTNEELTTSKEEMQSLNEELQTVNAELQSKVDDLTWERNDMTNLLNSTEIATLFLDNELRLRRFTVHATVLFKLIPSDVGRPLSDVSSDLDYPELTVDAREVLRTLTVCEKALRTHDGRWYRVRIMPYRTQSNVIDGVVLTFTDITAIKRLEAELRGQQK